MLVIGADTVVAFQGQILGKPADAKQAKEMLKTLASDVHQVYTGVALIVIQHGKRPAPFWIASITIACCPIAEHIITFAPGSIALIAFNA